MSQGSPVEARRQQCQECREIVSVEGLGRRKLPENRPELRFQFKHAARQEALDNRCHAICDRPHRRDERGAVAGEAEKVIEDVGLGGVFDRCRRLARDRFGANQQHSCGGRRDAVHHEKPDDHREPAVVSRGGIRQVLMRGFVQPNWGRAGT